MKVLVYPCGTKVIMNNGNIPGYISKFEASFESVSYQISYILNNLLYSIWLNEKEFTLETKVNRTSIGFVDVTVSTSESLTKEDVAKIVKDAIDAYSVNASTNNVFEIRTIVSEYLKEHGTTLG